MKLRRSSGIAIAIAVGVAAIVAPIWISIQLAWNEALANEESKVHMYASDLVRRSEEAQTQVTSAYALLDAAHLPPCSPDEIALMQELEVTSSYIQAIGRISGNQITCSSLGAAQPIDIGPPDLTNESGAQERYHVWVFKAQTRPLLVIARDGFAFIVNSAIEEDLPAVAPDISAAIFVPSQRKPAIVATANGGIATSWLRNIRKGASTTFLDGGYVISVVRSLHSDTAAVAASPSIYVWQQIRPFAFIFIPMGLLCAGGLAWAVAHIYRARLSLPAALRRAAKQKEFFVEYQPIVDLATRRWVGAEALVRWRRGGRSVQPDHFIPLAEESGIITQITECVAEIVAADLPSLLKIDPQFHVGINLSGPDLLSSRTIDLLGFVMGYSNARPHNLQVEATERHILQGEESRTMIAEIRALGISVAIDDFGTGYSSLSYLQTLDPDVLKIDKSFVDTIGTDGATSQVVPHIIGMAHSLKLIMIAEGVETEDQARFLRNNGVHFAQGWLFGKPMSSAALSNALQSAAAGKAEETV